VERTTAANTAAHQIDPLFTLDVGLFEQNYAARIRAIWDKPKTLLIYERCSV
jgi:hypothetical protein